MLSVFLVVAMMVLSEEKAMEQHHECDRLYQQDRGKLVDCHRSINEDVLTGGRKVAPPKNMPLPYRPKKHVPVKVR